MAAPIRTLFVCAGNICRSPMAEAVFAHKVRERGLEGRFVVDSAGLGAWHAGEPPDRRTIQTLAAHGMKWRSRARQIRTDDFYDFDHILIMDEENEVGIRRYANIGSARVSLLMSWAKNPPRLDVPDPYYGDHYDFEQVFCLVDLATDGFLAQVLADRRDP